MKTILLAEDDTDDQDIVREIVQLTNAEVDLHIFPDGESLLAWMKQLPEDQHPSLVVVDQNMPKLKGNETIVHLKEISGFEDVPVVIYTTYHDNKFAETCRRLNVELFLKPDTFDGFEKMIGGLMKRHVSG